MIHKPCYFPQGKVGADKAGSHETCGPSKVFFHESSGLVCDSDTSNLLN